MTIKLKRVPNKYGMCGREYFMDDEKYLYCLDDELYACSKDGEPSHRVKREGFKFPKKGKE